MRGGLTLKKMRRSLRTAVVSLALLASAGRREAAGECSLDPDSFSQCHAEAFKKKKGGAALKADCTERIAAIAGDCSDELAKIEEATKAGGSKADLLNRLSLLETTLGKTQRAMIMFWDGHDSGGYDYQTEAFSNSLDFDIQQIADLRNEIEHPKAEIKVPGPVGPDTGARTTPILSKLLAN